MATKVRIKYEGDNNFSYRCDCDPKDLQVDWNEKIRWRCVNRTGLPIAFTIKFADSSACPMLSTTGTPWTNGEARFPDGDSGRQKVKSGLPVGSRYKYSVIVDGGHDDPDIQIDGMDSMHLWHVPIASALMGAAAGMVLGKLAFGKSKHRQLPPPEY